MSLQITFRHMQPSDSVEVAIRKRASELERFHPRIVGCHVVFEQGHRHQNKGRLFHVRIDLKVPGGTLCVGHEQQDAHAHEDAYVAIRDSFDAMRRQLEDFVRRQDGRVKKHFSSVNLLRERVVAKAAS